MTTTSKDLNGDPLTEWDTPFWQHDLTNGIALLRNAVETHIITSWHAAPLLAALLVLRRAEQQVTQAEPVVDRTDPVLEPAPTD